MTLNPVISVRGARVSIVTSIVIAAHNEDAVVGRWLDAVLADAAPENRRGGPMTARVLRRKSRPPGPGSGARLPSAGKVAALNAGNAVAVGYPRIYLDSDILIPTHGSGRCVTPSPLPTLHLR
jgi:hypothetical protein